MVGVWNEKVVEALEKGAFYIQGDREKPLTRESDLYLLQEVKNNAPSIKNTVVDYGCGTGRLMDLIKFPINYTGYDSSPDMIKKAQEKFPDAKFFNDFDEALKKNKVEKFDVLINIDVLQHSRDIDDFKQKLHDFSKLAKVSIFHFWYKQNDFNQMIGLEGQKFSEVFPSPETIINFLFDSELNNLKIKFFPECKPYPTVVITKINPEVEEKKAKK